MKNHLEKMEKDVWLRHIVFVLLGLTALCCAMRMIGLVLTGLSVSEVFDALAILVGSAVTMKFVSPASESPAEFLVLTYLYR